MAATRTQIYMTAKQRARVDEVRRREGTTLAEVVRAALDAYLPGSDEDVDTALAATFGSMPEIEVPSRDEWDRGG